MPKKPPRKTRELKAAVNLAGSTMEAFAAGLEVTSQHLRLVLSGKRESPRVSAAVDAFIEKHLPRAGVA